jgi:hypothetical protein
VCVDLDLATVRPVLPPLHRRRQGAGSAASRRTRRLVPPPLHGRMVSSFLALLYYLVLLGSVPLLLGVPALLARLELCGTVCGDGRRRRISSSGTRSRVVPAPRRLSWIPVPLHVLGWAFRRAGRGHAAWDRRSWLLAIGILQAKARGIPAFGFGSLRGIGGDLCLDFCVITYLVNLSHLFACLETQSLCSCCLYSAPCCLNHILLPAA